MEEQTRGGTPPDLVTAGDVGMATQAETVFGGAWLYIGLGVLLLVLVLALGFWLWRSRSRDAAAGAAAPRAEAAADDAAPAGDGVEVFLSPSGMRRSFRNGLAIYRDYVAGSGNLYLVPWYVTVGEVGSGKSALLGALDRSRQPAETIDEQTGRPAGCTWWYYDNAVVLDVGGESILRSDATAVPDLAWGRLLSLLARHRARRPADGIILTLPVTDFFGPTRLPEAVLARKARALYSKLWQAQKVLGLCLPVYVVLTKCDALPGFSEFARALPEARRNDILGWSSPQATDAVYHPSRIDEALNVIGNGLRRAQLELFAEARPVDSADDVFLLPQRLEDIRGPLRQTLGTIFRQTAYMESLFLRGIYLVGDMNALPAASGDSRQMVFLRDLFGRKIFSEFGLVRPTPRWSLRHNRRQIAIRAGLGAMAAAAAVWLWTGAETLSRTVGSLVPVVNSLPGHLDAARQGRYGQPDGTPDAQRIADMIRDYTRIAPDWDSGLLPAALFSSAEQRAATILSVGHYKVVMEAVRSALHQRGAQLTAGPAPEGDAAAGPRQLARLAASVDDLARFEGAVALFNGIHGSENLAGLDLLIRYALGISVPPELLDRAETYGFTLPPDNASLAGVSLQAELRSFDTAVYRAAARVRVLELVDDYFRALSTDDGLAARMAEIAADLDRLGGGTRAPGAYHEALVRLSRNLNHVSDHFASRDASWIGLRELSFGPEMQDILARVADSRLLGPEVRDEIVARARETFAQMRATTLSMDETIIGPLLERSEGARSVRLSPAADALRVSLRQWMAMPFMTAAADGAAAAAMAGRDAGSAMIWDLDTLDSAIGLAEDYLLFEAQQIVQFPEALRPGIRSVSRGRVADGILETVARARVPYAPGNTLVRRRVESDLRVQVRSFGAAGPTLLQLLQTLDVLAVPVARDRLHQGIVQPVAQLLGRVDELLQDDAPYTPPGGGFAWWEGETIEPFRVFGVAGPVALADHLAAHRRRLSVLAQDLAEPLVELLYQPALRSGEALVPELDKWADILVQLDRYENARPTSALAELERFITEDLAQVDLSNCQQASSGRAGSEAARGYFGGRQAMLRRGLEERCLALVDTRLVHAYEAIREHFDRTLAGRYPFAPVEDANAGHQASIEDVKAFFQVFDDRAPALIDFLRANDRYGVPGVQARRFLEEMAAVRAFLAPALSPEAAAGRSRYVLEPVFRANRDHEIGGSEIIEWTLQTGAGAVNNYAATPQLAWQVGQPVSLRLRWARNGPTVPQGLGGGLGAVSPEERVATFSYRGPWGLVALVRQHRVPPAAMPASAKLPPHLMSFDVDANGPTPEVRVYAGLAVRGEQDGDGGVSTMTDLAIPTFPTAAPTMRPESVPMAAPRDLPAPVTGSAHGLFAVTPAAPVQSPAPLPAAIAAPAPAPAAAPAPAQTSPLRALPAPLTPGGGTMGLDPGTITFGGKDGIDAAVSPLNGQERPAAPAAPQGNGQGNGQGGAPPALLDIQPSDFMRDAR